MRIGNGVGLGLVLVASCGGKVEMNPYSLWDNDLKVDGAVDAKTSYDSSSDSKITPDSGPEGSGTDSYLPEGGTCGVSLPPTRITSSASHTLAPSLVWTGYEYGLVYLEAFESQVRFRRINESGGMLTDTAVADGMIWGDHNVAWSGSQYGVTWGGHAQMNFRGFSWAGEPLNATTLGHLPTSYSAIAWAGSHFAVVWIDDRARFARVTPEGTLLGEPLEIGPQMQFDGFGIAVVFTGDSYGVVWAQTGTESHTLQYSRISLAGALELKAAALTEFHIPQLAPIQLSWTGDSFVALWASEPETGPYQINRLVFAREGSVISAPSLDPGQSFWGPVALWHKGMHRIAWQTAQDAPWAIKFASTPLQGGKIADPLHVSDFVSEPIGSWNMSIAERPEGVALAWPDGAFGNYEIHLATLACP